MTFKYVAENAGLNKIELAQLYGVSRQMVHYWLTVSGPRKQTYTARMEEVITAALMQSIKNKVLPLGAMNHEARAARISAMSQRLQSLKPAPIKK